VHEDRNTGAGFGITSDMRQLGGFPLFDNNGEEKLAADIGAGHWSPVWDEKTKLVRFDGRADVNPDYICDLRAIPEMWFNKFDYIYSGHVIEHFAREEVRGLIIHWLNLLKIGGQFEFRCPNVEYAMRRIIDRIDKPTPAYSSEDVFMRHYDWQMLYGSQQGYDTAFHRTGFVARTLFQLLNSIEGLTDVSVELYNNDQELRARGTLSKRIEVASLLEWWNEIEQQENISVHSHLIQNITYPSLDEVFTFSEDFATGGIMPEGGVIHTLPYHPSISEIDYSKIVEINKNLAKLEKSTKKTRQDKVLEKDCK
jgi:predicted SAM-dependent methyltransferase